MPLSSSSHGFSTGLVIDMFGATLWQLDRWDHSGVLSPSLAPAAGSGSRRCYSYSDLLALKFAQEMSGAGMRLAQIRKTIQAARDLLDASYPDAYLVINGASAVVCPLEEAAELVRNNRSVLFVLPLSGAKEQVDAAISGRDCHTAS